MKLVMWHAADGEPSPGLLTARGVVPLPDVTSMEQLIDDFPSRRADLEKLAAAGPALALHSVHLLSPLPRPGKILCSTTAYAPASGDPAPLLMTLKSAES